MTLNINDSTEDLLPSITQEYKILVEYKMLQSEDIGGIYVIPSYDNSFVWFGVIFVRQGYYKDGIFRFNIILPNKFPEAKTVPTIVFQKDLVFHPLISPYDGTLDLSEVFPTWITGSTHIWQILKFIKYIFLHPEECLNTNSSTSTTTTAATDPIQSNFKNQLAADLLSQNKGEFLTKVKNCVQESCERIYDPAPTDDRNYIVFEKFNTETHGHIIESFRKNKINDILSSLSSITSSSSSPSGVSWVKEGEFKPLSKD